VGQHQFQNGHESPKEQHGGEAVTLKDKVSVQQVTEMVQSDCH
jgi:hypothetical protein